MLKKHGNSHPVPWLWLALILNVLADSAPAQDLDWPTLGFAPVVTNAFSAPTSITHAGDGSQRLFVAERGGQIGIIKNNSLVSQPFLDIGNRVLTAGFEQGLLGLAFPPGYSTNAHFYVDYTRQPDGAVVVSRFSLTPDANVADTNSEQVILVIPKGYNNHNGGQLAFGPDGYLYIGVGDGGSEQDPDNRGQYPGTLLGKLLRIDVESGVSPYAVPTNNPFVGNTNYAPEIWALGLRNPWRFSFDRSTGDLYIGDVGQGRYEEVDFQLAGSPGGQNYGWRITEGPTNFNVPAGFTNFSALTSPVTSYDHGYLPTDFAASITGGYVYRGPSEPRMDGMYFFGDFVAGWFWGLKRIGTNWQRFEIITPQYSYPPSHLSPSTFGEDEQGHLYLADYYQGMIYQIQDTHQAIAPTFSPTNGATLTPSNIVMVSCVTPGAEIHYTTNGVDPTLSDPVVPSGGTIQVFTGFTNKARAFRADLNPSGTARAIFTCKVALPSFNPPNGPITNGTSVTISSATPGAKFYYSTNLLLPTTNSPITTGLLVINGNTPLRAIGTAAGYVTSAVASASYALAQVAPLILNPPVGPVTNGTLVSISSATPGAVIHYTIDGSTPTTNSPVYSTPITITNPLILRAQGFKQAWGSTPVTSIFYYFQSFEQTVVTTVAGSPTPGFTNGIGVNATFSQPEGICIDASNNLYVADTGNNVIRRILPSGEVTTFAGTGDVGSADGATNEAQFTSPTGVAIGPSGDIYVADSGNCNRIRKIDTTGIVTTLASVTDCSMGATLRQIEVDPGGVCYAGSFAAVYRVAIDDSVTTFAGPADPGAGTGWGWTVGVGLDRATNVYAATLYKVWKTTPEGSTELFAGSSNIFATSGFSDGPRLSALFYGTQDTAVDSATNVFVSDFIRIRKIRADGWVSTVAGTSVAGYKNGQSSSAQFNGAMGLCVDSSGNIYVADSGNNCVRKLSPDTAGIGIADDWQVAHFGRVGINPNDDADHDGMSNYAEFWAGTDPLDSNSSLAIDSTSLVSGGQIQIRWRTVAGKSYIVQYSTNLTDWNDLGSPLQGDGSFASVIDPTTIANNRFYRVRLSSF